MLMRAATVVQVLQDLFYVLFILLVIAPLIRLAYFRICVCVQSFRRRADSMLFSLDGACNNGLPSDLGDQLVSFVLSQKACKLQRCIMSFLTVLLIFIFKKTVKKNMIRRCNLHIT